MKKAVVTGGAGFIGSHVVDGLIEKGYEVHVIDNMSAGKRERVNPKATLHEKDIRNLEDIKPIIAGADYVFHLAALPQVQYSIEHPDDTGAVNVLGTINVLMAAQEANVKKVVYSSSAAVYGDQETIPVTETMPIQPKSPYALEKYIGEEYMKLWSVVYNVPTVSLRYFNVYGPRQNPHGAYALLIAKFLQLKKEGKPLTIAGDGEQTRDFVHVSDVARANILAAEHPKLGGGEFMNIGAGKNFSIKHIAQRIGGPVEHIAPRFEIKHSLADTLKAKKLLDWEPKISLEEGIQELLRIN